MKNLNKIAKVIELVAAAGIPLTGLRINLRTKGDLWSSNIRINYKGERYRIAISTRSVERETEGEMLACMGDELSDRLHKKIFGKFPKYMSRPLV